MAHALTNFALPTGPYRAHTGNRLSASGIALVAGAHLAVLALLANLDQLPAMPAQPALMVDLIAPPAALVTPPRPTPPQPAVERRQPTPRRTPTPAPVAQIAAPAETTAAAATVPMPTAAPANPPAAPASTAAPAPAPVSEPRFDADYLSNPAPAYPAISRRLGEEGKVLLRVFVEPGGRPSRVELKASSGSPRLDAAAQDAVQRWRFAPARRGDEAIGAWVLVPIVFNLKG